MFYLLGFVKIFDGSTSLKLHEWKINMLIRKVILLISMSFVLLVIMLQSSTVQAEVLFSDDFAGQVSEMPAKWEFGDDPRIGDIAPGVIFMVKDIDPTGGIDEVLELNVGSAEPSNPYSFHTKDRFNFKTTGNKFIRLDVTVNILESNSQIRVGLYNAPASSGGASTAAYHFRIRNNKDIDIITFTTGSKVVDNSSITLAETLPKGRYGLSLVVDFSSSDINPTVIVLIDNKKVHQITPGTEGGFDWGDATTIGIMSRVGQSKAPASVKYDNWKLATHSKNGE